MNEYFLKARDLRKIYKFGAKEVCALDGVSIDIGRGESTAVIGPSGAGKSTLLHILGGLDSPTSGEVMLDGADLYAMPDESRSDVRNRRVGFVFQSYHLLPEFTALENVMLPAMISGRRAENRAAEVLELVGLTARLSHKPGELSGGESQRAAIARALMNDPEILLCDEPTGNLDSKTSESIYELLFGIKTKSNMALVIVTHDESLSKRTDHFIRIKDGKVVST